MEARGAEGGGDQGGDAQGGEAPCWAHLVDDEGRVIVAGDELRPETGSRPLMVDLGAVHTEGGDGVVWSLPHDGDLDANLVHLGPDGAIGSHVNAEVDVLFIVVSGWGEAVVDTTAHALERDALLFVPRGVSRQIRAGHHGMTYVTVHRRRSPLGLSHP